jgi:hypothetical protein
MNPSDFRQSLTRHARLLTKTDDHFSEFVARLGVKASGDESFHRQK